MSSGLRIGILGAAAIAPTALIEPAAGHPRCRVVAIAARDPLRAQRFADRHSIDTVHSRYQDLIDDPDIDAVYNPLPNGLHGYWTRAAIAAGKHVLCEKPFASNAAEAQAVADLAAGSPDTVVMEAFHWRYHPMAKRMIELVGTADRPGVLGRIESASGSFCVPMHTRNDIRWDETLAGGSLMDLGCYPLHMLRTLLGEASVLDAVAQSVNGIDRALRARLTFDGVPAKLSCSMWSSRLLNISVVVRGSLGTMRAVNPVLPQRGGWIHVTPRRGHAGTPAPRIERTDRTATYRFQLDAFVAAVRDGAPFPTTADDAVATMSAIDSMYRFAGMAIRQPTPVD